MTTSLLLADSGATKTTWYWVEGQQASVYTTSGCQPYYRTTAELIKSLQEELLPHLSAAQPTELWFYGSGCGAAAPRQRVIDALHRVFPQAQRAVSGDLLGAARATAGQQAGICCILGTGSASGHYDGHQIVDQVPSLGYLLGDEGSGADLGRRLLQAYFYRQMPADIHQAFEAQYQPNRPQIIQQLLEGGQPSRTLATYALFAAAWKDHPFLQELILARFEAFLDGQIAQYKAVETLPIHAIGSVAEGFQDLWRKALQTKGWQVGNIYKSPFPALLDYHNTNTGSTSF